MLDDARSNEKKLPHDQKSRARAPAGDQRRGRARLGRRWVFDTAAAMRFPEPVRPVQRHAQLEAFGESRAKVVEPAKTWALESNRAWQRFVT